MGGGFYAEVNTQLQRFPSVIKGDVQPRCKNTWETCSPHGIRCWVADINEVEIQVGIDYPVSSVSCCAFIRDGIASADAIYSTRRHWNVVTERRPQATSAYLNWYDPQAWVSVHYAQGSSHIVDLWVELSSAKSCILLVQYTMQFFFKREPLHFLCVMDRSKPRFDIPRRTRKKSRLSLSFYLSFSLSFSLCKCSNPSLHICRKNQFATFCLLPPPLP